MSGFFLSTGPAERQSRRDAVLDEVGSHLRPRGPDPSLREIVRSEHCSAMAVRHAWEVALGAGIPVYSDDRVVVAADASLYYRADLALRLSGGPGVDADSAAGLIGHAYQRHGVACVDILEGDFAFALWDRNRKRLFAARDPFGSRSLFYWAGVDGVALSSLPDPLRAVAGDPELDLKEIVRSLTIFHGDGSGTPWRGIQELPAGWSLEWQADRPPVARRYWYPGVRSEWSGGGVEEAGSILADLIGEATAERMGPGKTAVGMSGGRDSTAMVGALERQRSRAPGGVPPLSVLSFQYPEGDPGNEDAYVRQIEAALGLDVQWLDTTAMPLLAGAAAEGGRRTRPEPQPFEGQNRALAAAARVDGCDVLLNGNGGDNLFGLADSWLADLLRTGRWFRLTRMLREKGYRRARDIYAVCVRPSLSMGMMDRAEGLLGRRIMSRPWEDHAPPWLRKGLPEYEEIFEEDREAYRRDIESFAGSVTERFRLWAFTYSGFSRNSASLFDMSLDEGVELRMPFYDRRIADFAWSRPPEDLNRGREHKVILRHAMKGILPDEVIAPRNHRTGTSDGYYRTAAAREFHESALSAMKNSRLVDLGLVDHKALATAVEGWTSGDRRHELLLFMTICVEFWLRAHDTWPSPEQNDTSPGTGHRPSALEAVAQPGG